MKMTLLIYHVVKANKNILNFSNVKFDKVFVLEYENKIFTFLNNQNASKYMSVTSNIK